MVTVTYWASVGTASRARIGTTASMAHARATAPGARAQPTLMQQTLLVSLTAQGCRRVKAAAFGHGLL